jgi:hypothetical protein
MIAYGWFRATHTRLPSTLVSLAGVYRTGGIGLNSVGRG